MLFSVSFDAGDVLIMQVEEFDIQILFSLANCLILNVTQGVTKEG
jgi:hypothetical protein